MFAKTIQSAIIENKVLVGAPPVGYPLNIGVIAPTKGHPFLGFLLRFLSTFEKEALIREYIDRSSTEEELEKYPLRGYVLNLEEALLSTATSLDGVNLFVEEVFFILGSCGKSKLMYIGRKADKNNPFSPISYSSVGRLEDLNYHSYHLSLDSAKDEVLREVEKNKNKDIEGEK